MDPETYAIHFATCGSRAGRQEEFTADDLAFLILTLYHAGPSTGVAPAATNLRGSLPTRASPPTRAALSHLQFKARFLFCWLRLQFGGGSYCDAFIGRESGAALEAATSANGGVPMDIAALPKNFRAGVTAARTFHRGASVAQTIRDRGANSSSQHVTNRTRRGLQVTELPVTCHRRRRKRTGTLVRIRRAGDAPRRDNVHRLTNLGPERFWRCGR